MTFGHSHTAPGRTAIVFFTDQGYLDLAKGLVGSLTEHVAPRHSVDVVCVDIGLSGEGRAWMEDANVALVAPDVSLVPETVLAIIADKPHRIAQVLRPYLPTLLPAYDTILHMDADTWVQNDEFYRAFMACLAEDPTRCVLAPALSHYGYSYYFQLDEIMTMHSNWTFGLFERSMAEALAHGMFFSSGVFAMHRDSLVWALWARELERMYVLGSVVNQTSMHLHEQTALNSVVRVHGLVSIVDPLFNFHCNSGGARRCDKSDKVVTALVSPRREISVVHLANWGILHETYRDQRLTYAA